MSDQIVLNVNGDDDVPVSKVSKPIINFRLRKPSVASQVTTSYDVDKIIAGETLEDEDVNIDDLDLGTSRSKYLIPVNHPYRAYWDLLVILALVFTATVTPFEVSFLEPVISPLFFVNRVVDFIFLVDMGITLLTPVLDEDNGVWITTHWGIFREYAKFWFWIDLLSVIPFDAVSVALEEQNAGAGGNLQGIRLLRLLRLIKLVRVVRASRILKRREADMDMKYSTMTLIKFSVYIMTLMHWISCLMALIPHLEVADPPFSWVTFYFEGALGFSSGEYNIWSIYLAGLYYAAATLTTIGYGDVTPKTDAERGVACIIMLFGATFYAYVVGNICSIVQKMDKITAEFHNELDSFANFLDDKQFPSDIKRRLKKYTHFTWAKKKQIYHRQLLLNLSDALQKEIAFEISKAWVQHVPFLSEVISPPESGEYDQFVQEISLKLTPEAYPAEETLIAKGEMMDRLIIIERGTAFSHITQVSELSDRRTSMVNREVKVATCFGAEMVIDDYISPLYVTAVTDVDVLILTKADLFDILEKLPITKRNIRMLAARRNWEKFKSRVDPSGKSVAAEFDPEEPEKEIVKEIVTLNHEIKALNDQLFSLQGSLVAKSELLKVVKGEGEAD